MLDLTLCSYESPERLGLEINMQTGSFCLSSPIISLFKRLSKIRGLGVFINILLIFDNFCLIHKYIVIVIIIPE